MSIQSILQLGDPRLRLVSEDVMDFQSEETAETIQDLIDTLHHALETTGYGRAIAAVQIGVMKKIIVLCLPQEEPRAFINPRIVWRSANQVLTWDACLSFLSIFMQVKRYQHITVEYFDTSGKKNKFFSREEPALSELFQHEIDHLNGILAIDRVSDFGTICTREEFEKRFKKDTSYEQPEVATVREGIRHND